MKVVALSECYVNCTINTCTDHEAALLVSGKMYTCTDSANKLFIHVGAVN